MDCRPTTTAAATTSSMTRILQWPTVCAPQINPFHWCTANHYLHLHFLLQGSGAGLNSSVALEEYVDILSVQQLLLDTPTTTSSLAGHSSSSGTHGVSKPRPRLNVQKAVEYSTVVGSHASAGGKSRSPISIHTSHRNLSRRIASYVTLSWKCCIAPH